MITKLYELAASAQGYFSRSSPDGAWYRKVFSLKLGSLALLIIMAVAFVFRPSLKGDVYPSTVPAAEIKLTDHNGQLFQLSSFRGKVVLVFFGFTNCLIECPAAMAIIRQALQTDGMTSKDVEVVMVSTDPNDDTPQSMKEFMGRFSPSFLGLLGARDNLAKTWQDYGVTVLDDGETHSSLTYVVDKRGALRETFSPDTSPDDIAYDLKILLAEK